MAKKSDPKKSANEKIHFRVSPYYLEVLRVYGERNLDDSGQILTPSLAARKLVSDAIKKLLDDGEIEIEMVDK